MILSAKGKCCTVQYSSAICKIICLSCGRNCFSLNTLGLFPIKYTVISELSFWPGVGKITVVVGIGVVVDKTCLPKKEIWCSDSKLRIDLDSEKF